MTENIVLYIVVALCLIFAVIVILLARQIGSLKKTVSESEKKIASSVSQSIGQMVQTSYSMMNQNMDNKLSNSFNSINQGLGQLQSGLGQMKSMADGVDELRKVLSNVKTRGILGELQAGAILDEILTPNQYECNAETVPGSNRRVEYAVKLPGNGDYPVYLPIDSKFPGDAYAHLLDAYQIGNADSINDARKVLIGQFKKEAADISSKYIQTPYTTDFGVMFLPFEGLYAEAVNLGMIEVLLREYSVVLAGPSTLSALLSSLRMGFKTLAIQQNADQVWEILSDVKKEFDAYADVLDDIQKDVEKTGKDIDKLVGVRTRAIQRKLAKVQTLQDADGDGFIDEE